MVIEHSEYSKSWLDPTNRILLGILPMYHAAGLNRLINNGIINGSTVVVLEKYTVDNMCRAIQTFRVTDLPAAPPILLHLLNNPIVDDYDLSSLRTFNVGAAPIGPDTVRHICVD